MNESPESIYLWSNNTFGHTPVRSKVSKLDEEASELAKAEHQYNFGNASKDSVAEELADVYIVAIQIIEQAKDKAKKHNINIEESIDHEMAKNRGRIWETNSNGNPQHTKGMD